MKISFVLAFVAALILSCNGNKSQEQDTSIQDSLQAIIDEKDQQNEELVCMITEIQEGFALINEAEGRVNSLSTDAENASAYADIEENMAFIQRTMADNKRKIAELQRRLNMSNQQSAKMQSMINNLTNLLNDKAKEIEELRAKLAEQDIKIAEQDESIAALEQENTEQRATNDELSQQVQQQDAELNTAYFVYGTTKELKEHQILVDGDVLTSTAFDKEYFTKIDIRKTSIIALHSKSVKLLTTHPEGSYSLLKDSDGYYSLRISDIHKFWSISKYLVVRVK